MSTNPRQPLPLPASAIPDGCLPWDGEQARRWIGALPPPWVPVRLRASVVVAVVSAAGLSAGGSALFGGLRGWAAACLALQVVSAGMVHPYDRTAAEITAMWQDPTARPVGVSDEGQRGRPLWPLAVLVALGWTAALLWV